MNEEELIKELELLADSCDSNYALEVYGYSQGVNDAIQLVKKALSHKLSNPQKININAGLERLNRLIDGLEGQELTRCDITYLEAFKQLKDDLLSNPPQVEVTDEWEVEKKFLQMLLDDSDHCLKETGKARIWGRLRRFNKLQPKEQIFIQSQENGSNVSAKINWKEIDSKEQEQMELEDFVKFFKDSVSGASACDYGSNLMTDVVNNMFNQFREHQAKTLQNK